MKWIEIKSNDDLPKDGQQHIFDADNGEPPVWGKVEYFDKQPFLILIDSSGEEECHDLKPYYRWLDESPESPSPSLQEAAEAYADKTFPIGRDTKSLRHKTTALYGFKAGWNAREAQQIEVDYLQTSQTLSQTREKPFFIDVVRKILSQYDREEISLSRFVEELNVMAYSWKVKDSQQTAPLLTREVFDKIWEAAISWKMEQIIISEFSEGLIPTEKNPDKETFYKSLNL